MKKRLRPVTNMLTQLIAMCVVIGFAIGIGITNLGYAVLYPTGDMNKDGELTPEDLSILAVEIEKQP